MKVLGCSVTLKIDWHDADARMHTLKNWCTQHLGERHQHWNIYISHMDYEDRVYTVRYSFANAEDAAAFAVTWG